MVSSLSKPDKRHTHYRRNLLIICLLLGIVLITFCFLLCQHDSQDMDCDCLRCLLSAPPQEGEYLYNRYLLLISVLCFILEFCYQEVRVICTGRMVEQIAEITHI